MNISCSPAGIVNPDVPGQGTQDMANAGFGNIFLEFGICCSPYELERSEIPEGEAKGQEQEGNPEREAGVREQEENPEREAGVREQEGNSKEEAGEPERETVPVVEEPSGLGFRFAAMVGQCREKGLKIPIARAPFLLRDTKRTDLEEQLLRIHEESIRCCGEWGCRYLVVRPLFAGIPSGQEWEKNRSYYLHLAELAREQNVVLLLENQCRSVNGHLIRGICSDGSEAAMWVDRLNQEAGEERFGFCMDVGTCSLCGQDMHELACVLGSRIKAVILRDCNGHQENSLLPFTCTAQGQPQTEWLSLIRGLREIGFEGELALDMSGTATGFSPLLRPQLLALAKATAEYVRWQVEMETQLGRYGSIVLFGAGNMCRNYMKCYGEKYPPLFTCDNNRKLWGTRFCGLEVRPPEALRELPEDCGVLICNIYYREIEKQLRELGVKRIGFFNDEYMPSFYFDRLKEFGSR